jgi:hypothetical protein
MASQLTQADREFLQHNFARYGEAWRPGFEMLERLFTLEAVKKWRSYELRLTSRDVFALRYVLTIGRKNGRLACSQPRLPAGPDLGPAEFAQVDEILEAAGELYLLEPLNNECELVPLERGLAGLQAGRDLATRRNADHGLLFFTDREHFRELFCVSIDLAQQTISEIQWCEMPPAQSGRWIRPAEVGFIDRHLRQNGDFGVYGSVTMGLRALAEHFELKIRDEAGAYNFSVVPRDGHGHFLRFAMDKASGSIGAAAAGHLEPRPRLED